MPDYVQIEEARRQAEEHRKQIALLRANSKNAKALTILEGGEGGGVDSPKGLQARSMAADIDIASSLPFEPITLVFKNIRCVSWGFT